MKASFWAAYADKTSYQIGVTIEVMDVMEAIASQLLFLPMNT
jgi:hypothetical protein